MAFYEVERISRSREESNDEVHGRTFLLHVGSFGLYNALIGYLLHVRLATVGYVVGVGPLVQSAALVYLAGGMVLNSVREVLAAGDRTQFSTFALLL